MARELAAASLGFHLTNTGGTKETKREGALVDLRKKDDER
jgi:hypothetical protein